MTDKTLEIVKEALNQAWYMLDGQSDDIKPSNKEITQTSIKVQQALAELNSYIEARDSEGGQPIETAPKDGTIILTWQGGMQWRIACYNPHVKEWHYPSIGYSKEAPTHWMPLPQPPKTIKAMEGGE